MSQPSIFLFCAFFISAIAGLLLTFLAQAILARWGVIDDENRRSLHTGSIPRAGGVAIVLVVCIWQLVLRNFGNGLSDELFGVWLVTLAAAALGMADDFFSLSVGFRLLVQILIGLGFYYFGDFSDGGFAGAVAIAVVFMVLISINISNFMDGADGLLGTQAFAIVLCVAIWQGQQGKMSYYMYNVTLAGAILGFLYCNWAPAKIFLGDVGSYFIGATLAMFLLTVEKEALIPLLILLIPLGTDASLTLIRRIIAGKKFWTPHREHVYQRLVLQGSSHAQVSAGLLAFFVVVFLPISLASAVYSNFAYLLLLLSMMISIVTWLFLHRNTVNS